MSARLRTPGQPPALTGRQQINSDNDIQYFYASRLPGEPAAGVDDYHIHPMEPRTWRLGLRVAL